MRDDRGPNDNGQRNGARDGARDDHDHRAERADPDDPLAGIDLAAWQPPPPPARLADAVVARLRASPAAVALEGPPATASESPTSTAIDPGDSPVGPRSRRDRIVRLARVAGGTALAAAAIAGLALWGTTRAPRTGHGTHLTGSAEHLELDGTLADLDPGAELHWARDGHRISARQTRGTVHWTIADDDTLVLDTGPEPGFRPGGTSSTATIEASGASLRVEVQMNLSDTRMLGVTTAAAVVGALVTVAVYHGHTQTTSAGQIVQIEPGTVVELRPPALTSPGPAKRAEPPIAVGAAPDVQALQDNLAAANKRIAELTDQLAANGPIPTTVTPPALDSHRISGDKLIAPDEPTRRAIARSGTDKVTGSFKVCIDTSGVVSSVTRLSSTTFDQYDQTIERKMLDWRYRPYLIEGNPAPVCAAITFIYTPDVPAPAKTAALTCEPSINIDDALMQAANQYSNGYPSSALLLMRKALACRQDVKMYRLAATYACAAHEAAIAREMMAKVPSQYQAPIEQKCQLEHTPLD